MNEEFDKWLESQDESTKILITERFSKLENTVRATREERDTFKKELLEISKKVTEDSEAGKQLGELRDKLEATERKANFLESAVRQGVTRPNAAYALATSENLFTDKGTPDWDRIRESIPEIFKVSNTKNNAGSGTANALPDRDPNTVIREAAKKSIR